MPPLRDHSGDIPLYAGHFVDKHRQVFRKKVTGLSEGALEILKSRTWKGNVRELENAIQRGLLNAAGDRILEKDLEVRAEGRRPGSPAWDATAGLEAYIRTLAEQKEREIITDTLKRTGWNRTEAAQNLKISRKTLFNKMQQYGLEESPG